MIGDGYLDDSLKKLLAHILQALPEVAKIVSRQADAAHVVYQTATVVDVETPSQLGRVHLPNGPLPIEADVYREHRLTGEILVWIKDGLLIGLEQPWYTDDPPGSWPDPGDVKVAIKG